VDDGTLLSLFTEEPLTSMEELGLAEPLSPSVSALMDADLHNTGEHA
jgi:hypothetical protein